MTIKKSKRSMTLTSDPDFATQVIFRVHYGVTISLIAFKKKYHQFFFKIKDGSLIMNLILLGKCALMKVSSHLR